jgi:O-antigen biosynthesis protein
MVEDRHDLEWWRKKVSPYLIPTPIGKDLLPLFSLTELVNLWISGGNSVHEFSDEDASALIKDVNSLFFVAPADAILNPQMGTIIEQYVLPRPDVHIFYADDAEYLLDERLRQIHCKPQLDKALLLARDYIGFPLLIRPNVLFDKGSFEKITSSDFWYDLCVRLSSSEISYERIPRTLIGMVGQRAQAGTQDRLGVLEKRLPEYRFRSDSASGIIRAQRKFSSYPDVTVIIPTKRSLINDSEGALHITSLLDSLGKSTWPLERIHVLIGDDCGNDGFYAQSEWPFKIRVMSTRRDHGEKFNYAKKLNYLWRMARTELIVILNDDVVIDSPDWLEALYTFGLEADVGGVGARLLFPDRSIQHAGMVGGIHGVFAHPWYKIDAGKPTYEEWSNIHRDQSAVTGAVFATRRAVMAAVNGFDESFSLDFNDVDICLRMKLLGYRVVYTPHAQMMHHESASRKRTFASGEEISLFLNRWRECIHDDPMFNPQLDRTTSEITPLPSVTAELEGLATMDSFRRRPRARRTLFSAFRH